MHKAVWMEHPMKLKLTQKERKDKIEEGKSLVEEIEYRKIYREVKNKEGNKKNVTKKE